MRNVKLAVRMLLKTPFVTTVAVLSLALGIGANAAIYSMFDQMLLRPLPVPAPSELVNLALPGVKSGSTSCNMSGPCDVIWSYPMFRDLERQQTVLTGVAGHFSFGASLAVGDEPSTATGLYVSGSYFPVLGIQPAAGRLLGPADDEVIGANFVTVISHDFWRERFGENPNVVGRIMKINGHSMTIVGVAPRGFTGTTTGSLPQVFVPISMRGVFQTNFSGFENRRSYWIYLFGRLKPGVSMEQAKASLDGIVRPILTDVEAPLQGAMSDVTLERFKAKEMTVEPGRRGQSFVHQEAKTPLMMLFGVTGVVLLIACANIANLLLARGAGRATEMGVRLALGAGRRHLLVQLLTESVILSLAGGAASLLVAKWTLDFISSLLPPEVTSSLHFELQPSVIVFAGVLAVLTGLIFGMFPALHSTRADLISTIRAGAGQIAGGRAAARFRAALVTVQIALSMALLISAGLFLKSLVNVSKVDLGVKVEDVFTFAVTPLRAGYDSARAHVLYRRMEEELAAIPGVTAVTSAVVPLMANSNWGTDVRVQGFESGPDVDSNSRYNEIGAGYFGALGVELLDGRDFTTSDQLGTMPVAIVNETFARKFGLGKDAVGKFMGSNGNDSLTIQIVGLVPDVKYSDVKDTVPPVHYLPWRQSGRVAGLYFYVRSSLPLEQLFTSVPALMKRIDPGLPLEDMKTMPQQIKENVALDRMISILSAAFAILATLLAGVGLYGVLAYTVAQRTREIGVRMALGADGGRVQGMVLKQVGAMMLVGAVVGIGGAYALGKAAQSLLYGLEGNDPIVFLLAVLLLSAVALSAGYLPARRAAKVDPMHALRYD
ncbi:MAG TPA: ABC transporter permease [Gemmatimonadaceae bacterium]|nr:ABC transporter permease [Gemmatimonadaceae bacterium]